MWPHNQRILTGLAEEASFCLLNGIAVHESRLQALEYCYGTGVSLSDNDVHT